ncbi:craniofacial development protein 2-like [Symsagittifera roscoffensis]|uniref:craniofacial development protein 2-like n=1 Tax=Symsagittifera roscoffensis TaxID=84072 RepID=UPI00307B6ABE
MEWKAYSERLCYARLDAHPTPLSIISAYSPTENGEDTEKDAFYSLLKECLKAIPRKDVLLIGGDLNSKLGKQLLDEEKNIGKFAIGERNNNGQRLAELIVFLDLVAMNTTIQKKRRKLATWISNDRKTRNQIDYILTNRRWRSAINDTTIQNAWNNLAQSLHKAAEKAVGATTRKNNPWISGETLKLILDRNDATSKKQDASTIKEKRKAVNRFLLSKIKDIELAEARGD